MVFEYVGYKRGCEGKEIFSKNEVAKAVEKLKKEYEDKIKGGGHRIFKITGYREIFRS